MSADETFETIISGQLSMPENPWQTFGLDTLFPGINPKGAAGKLAVNLQTDCHRITPTPSDGRAHFDHIHSDKSPLVIAERWQLFEDFHRDAAAVRERYDEAVLDSSDLEAIAMDDGMLLRLEDLEAVVDHPEAVYNWAGLKAWEERITYLRTADHISPEQKTGLLMLADEILITYGREPLAQWFKD